MKETLRKRLAQKGEVRFREKEEEKQKQEVNRNRPHRKRDWQSQENGCHLKNRTDIINTLKMTTDVSVSHHVTTF